MDVQTKDRIASRFLEKPMTHMLVRALLFSFWFRIGFFGLLLLPVVLGLFMAKIWRTTPSDLRPVVRISGVDWLQSLSLRRTALRELSQGKAADGLFSYHLAVGNNPGDIELLRGFLTAVLQHAQPPNGQNPALGNASWLLRLNKTNLADLELAAAVFQKYGWDQYVIALLRPKKDQLTAPLQKTYLTALFNTGDYLEFERFWRKAESSGKLVHDLELLLYRSAAGLTRDSSASSPTKNYPRVEDYLDDEHWRMLAHRLYLRVCERRQDVDRYLVSLERLKSWKADRLTDYVRAWNLMAANGRRDEAVRRATEFVELPTTSLETVRLAEAFQALGLKESARKLLQRFSAEFGFVDGLWVMYGNLLVSLEDWKKVQQLAIEMRFNKHLGLRLADYSFLLEGMANLHQSRPGAAAAALSRIDFSKIEDVDLAFQITQSLRRLGYNEQVKSLLPALERLSGNIPEAWETFMALAYELKDSELLLRTTERLVSLRADDWTARNNRALALLISRNHPDEALRLTFPLATELSNVWPVQINHAMALAQNRRYDEADALLARIPVNALSESERTSYYFACVETLVHQKRFELARQFHDRIDPNHLFPVQRGDLKEWRGQLAAAPSPSPVELGFTR